MYNKVGQFFTWFTRNRGNSTYFVNAECPAVVLVLAEANRSRKAVLSIHDTNKLLGKSVSELFLPSSIKI